MAAVADHRERGHVAVERIGRRQQPATEAISRINRCVIVDAAKAGCGMICKNQRNEAECSNGQVNDYVSTNSKALLQC